MLVVHNYMADEQPQRGALEAALEQMGFESTSPTARVFFRLYDLHGGSAFVQHLTDSGLDAMVVLTKLSTIKGIALVLSGVRALICDVFVLNHRRHILPVDIVHAMLRSLGDLCSDRGMRLAHLSFYGDDDQPFRKQLARRLVEGRNLVDAATGTDSSLEARAFAAALKSASASSICASCLVVSGTWSDLFERSLIVVKDYSSLTVTLPEGVRVIEGSNFANKVILLDLAVAIQTSDVIGDVAAGAQAHAAACVIFEIDDHCSWHRQHLMFTRPWVTTPCLGMSSDAFKKLKNHVSSDSVGQGRFTMVVSACMTSTSVDSAEIRQALQYFRQDAGSAPNLSAVAAPAGETARDAIGSGMTPPTPVLESLAARCAALLGVQVRKPRGQNGLRILALDGGGSRGVALIELLRALVESLKPLSLSDVFDVVAGTSTGAIISCAHFLCDYALDDISRLYMDMAGQVFKNPANLLNPANFLRQTDYARYHHSEALYMHILESTEMNCPSLRSVLGQSEGRASQGV